MTKAETHYIAHMFEQIVEQNKAVLEAVGDMQAKVQLIPLILQRLDGHDAQFKIVIAAIKDLSRTEQQQNRRLDKLEAKTT